VREINNNASNNNNTIIYVENPNLENPPLIYLLISLGQTLPSRPSESHHSPPDPLTMEFLKPFKGFITFKYHGREYHKLPKPWA